MCLCMLCILLYSALETFVLGRYINKDYYYYYHLNKSDVKRRNTLGRLDQYTRRGLRLWNSQDCDAVSADK